METPKIDHIKTFEKCMVVLSKRYETIETLMDTVTFSTMFAELVKDIGFEPACEAVYTIAEAIYKTNIRPPNERDVVDYDYATND